VQQCKASDWEPHPQDFLTNLLHSDSTNSDTAAAAGSSSSSDIIGSNGSNTLREFGLAVHQLWSVLCRAVRGSMMEWQQDTLMNSTQKSICFLCYLVCLSADRCVYMLHDTSQQRQPPWDG
jgi:hypothetical protein